MAIEQGRYLWSWFDSNSSFRRKPKIRLDTS
nr:MAG TPA: hypothetical protein [Caudoviricetes sp.]